MVWGWRKIFFDKNEVSIKQNQTTITSHTTPRTVVSQRLTPQRLTHFTRFLEILKKLIILYLGYTKLEYWVLEILKQ